MVEPCPPPGGLGFSFFAGSGFKDSNGGTVPISFQMAVDSGATFHYLDDELLPKIELDMVDYVRMDPPIQILTVPPRPGSVEVRRPPLGGKNEGSIPVVLGIFSSLYLIPIMESVRA